MHMIKTDLRKTRQMWGKNQWNAVEFIGCLTQQKGIPVDGMNILYIHSFFQKLLPFFKVLSVAWRFAMEAERPLVTIMELHNKTTQDEIKCSNKTGLLPYSCCEWFLRAGHSGRATGSPISPAWMHLNQTQTGALSSWYQSISHMLNSTVEEAR